MHNFWQKSLEAHISPKKQQKQISYTEQLFLALTSDPASREWFTLRFCLRPAMLTTKGTSSKKTENVPLSPFLPAQTRTKSISSAFPMRPHNLNLCAYLK